MGIEASMSPHHTPVVSFAKLLLLPLKQSARILVIYIVLPGLFLILGQGQGSLGDDFPLQHTLIYLCPSMASHSVL